LTLDLSGFSTDNGNHVMDGFTRG